MGGLCTISSEERLQERKAAWFKFLHNQPRDPCPLCRNPSEPITRPHLTNWGSSYYASPPPSSWEVKLWTLPHEHFLVTHHSRDLPLGHHYHSTLESIFYLERAPARLRSYFNKSGNHSLLRFMPPPPRVCVAASHPGTAMPLSLCFVSQ